MVGFKWILFLIMFPFTVNGQISSITVRAGSEVTLPFEKVINDQGTCNRTTWMFIDSGNGVTLFERGRIHREAKSKSDRLSVTENCSLVIKKVTVEDVGPYTCRQFDESGQQQGPASVVLLSVVTMTEHQGSDEVTFSCSVSTLGGCIHIVKWLFSGKDVDKYNNQMKPSQSDCRADVIIPTSYFISTSMNDELLKCDVTDEFTGEVQQFPFSRQSSGEKPDKQKSVTPKSTLTTTTESTIVTCTKADKNKSATTSKSTLKTTTETSEPTSVHPGWMRFVIVTVGLTGLILSVVTVNIWTRTKGNKTQMDDKAVHDDEDEGDGTVNYEDFGENYSSVQ